MSQAAPLHPAAAPAHLRGPAAFILHHLRRRAPHVTALLLMVLGAGACAIGLQYVIKLLVDAMAGGGQGAAIWGVVGCFLGLIALESLLWRLTGWLGCRTTVGIGVDVRLDLFDHLGGQSMRYFAENRAGALGQRITATAGNFGALVNTVVWRVLPPCADFAGALLVFSLLDWRMAAALGGFVLLVTAGLIRFGERGRPLHRDYARRGGEVAGELVDVIGNMWAVKAFSAGDRERARLAAGFAEEAAAQRASWMHTEWARLLHDIALLLMAGSMLGWAVLLWQAGRVTPGDVVLISTLTFRILHGSREMALSLVDMAQQFGFIEDTLRVIAEPQTLRDAPEARPLQPRGGSLQFQQVHFAYGRGAEAIEGLSLSIPAGQKLGIVGPSGAGKSTLIHLLQRLHDVQQGEILIDGQPIRGVTQDSLRAALAVVPQEILLFHRTLRENILLARPEASEAELLAAAHAACCDDFIRRLPQGYDTLVGERGARLSGGQRQRIGLARAFLKPAPIILLDEATSALDTDSEMAIQQALRRMQRRTVIAVAHRLSTLASFDRVIVLRDGRIVEDGPPALLRGRDGPFRRMWQQQAEGLALEATG